MQAILIRATKVIGRETDFYPCDRTVRAARAPIVDYAFILENGQRSWRDEAGIVE